MKKIIILVLLSVAFISKSFALVESCDQNTLIPFLEKSGNFNYDKEYKSIDSNILSQESYILDLKRSYKNRLEKSYIMGTDYYMRDEDRNIFIQSQEKMIQSAEINLQNIKDRKIVLQRLLVSSSQEAYNNCLAELKSNVITTQPVIDIQAIPNITTNSNENVEKINRNLTIGSKGEDVKILQKNLGVEVTGYFGNLTKKAVISWQKQNNLSATGYFGVMSRSIWNK